MMNKLIKERTNEVKQMYVYSAFRMRRKKESHTNEKKIKKHHSWNRSLIFIFNQAF